MVVWSVWLHSWGPLPRQRSELATRPQSVLRSGTADLAPAVFSLLSVRCGPFLLAFYQPTTAVSKGCIVTARPLWYDRQAAAAWNRCSGASMAQVVGWREHASREMLAYPEDALLRCLELFDPAAGAPEILGHRDFRRFENF